MCEVELKSRLIRKSLNDPSDCRALIPNHLLFSQNHDFNPWFISTKKTCTTKRGGERFDYNLCTVIWHQWTCKYLPQLQAIRQKRLNPSRSFLVGDIILVLDERCPRSSWPLGLTAKIYAGRHHGLTSWGKVLQWRRKPCCTQDSSNGVCRNLSRTIVTVLNQNMCL